MSKLSKVTSWLSRLSHEKKITLFRSLVLMSPAPFFVVVKFVLSLLLSSVGFDPGGVISGLLSFAATSAWYLVTERLFQKWRASSRHNFSVSDFLQKVLYGAAAIAGAGCFGLLVSLLFTGMTQLVALSIGIAFTFLTGNVVFDVFNREWIGNSGSRSRDTVLRGFTVKEGVDEARRWIGREHRRVLRWGDAFVREGLEYYHGLVIGATGTGKTTYLSHAILNRVVPLAEIKSGWCGIVNDPKGSMVALMSTLLPEEHFYIMNPMMLDHPRCAGGNPFFDFQSWAMSQEFGYILIPIRSNSDSSGDYFEGSARTLAIALYFCIWLLLGERAEFRDFILACSDKSVMIALLSQRPLKFWKELLILRGKNADNIVSTLRTLMAPYHVVAAAWHRAPHKISAKTLLEKNAWVVLASDPNFPEASAFGNSLFIESGIRYTVSLPDVDPKDPERCMTFCLDEIQAIRPIKSLSLATQLGRSKGLSIWLSCLTIPGFQHAYGKEIASDIIGNCRHKAFLGLDGESAQYFSDKLGQHEKEVSTFSFGKNDAFSRANQYGPRGGGSSQSWSRSTTNSRSFKPECVFSVLPQELLESNPDYNKDKGGLFGYFVLPEEGIYKARIPWQEIDDFTISPPPLLRGERLEGQIDCNDPRLSLEPWSDEERKRLGLPTMKKMQEKQNKKQQQNSKRGNGKGRRNSRRSGRIQKKGHQR